MKLFSVVILIIHLIILFLTDIIAQDSLSYPLIKSKGLIPDHFISSSKSKYEKSLKEDMTFYLSRKERMAEKSYYLESNFWIDQLNRSGNVLFENEITNYLKRIINLLLKDNVSLKDNISVYLVRSSYANAFAVDNGSLYVNLGLLAKVRDEAELAFVFAHEISHIIKNHGIKGYVEATKIEEGIGMYKNQVYKEKLLARHCYTRQQERIADINGFKMFRKTDYSLNSLIETFNLLENAYYPVDNIKFDFAFFKNQYIDISKKNLQVERKIDIIRKKNNNNFYNTHPDAAERKEYLMKRIKDSLDINKGQKFIISRDDFRDMQKKVRYELCRQLIEDGFYEKTIYNSYILLNDQGYKNKKFLKKIIAKALLNIIIDINKYNVSGYRVRFDQYRKYSKLKEELQLFTFFNSLSEFQIAGIAYAYILKLRDDYEADKEIDMLIRVAKYGFLNSSIIFKNRNGYYKNLDSTTYILKNNSLLGIQKEKANWLIQFLNNDVVKAGLDDAIEIGNKEIRDYKSFRTLPYRKKKRLIKDYERKGENLGFDTIVYVNPLSSAVDFRKWKNNVQYLEGERIECKYLERLMDMNKYVDGNIKILDARVLNKHEVDRFNYLGVLNNWIMNRINCNDKYYMPLYKDEIDRIIEEFGTKYYTWSGLFVAREWNSDIIKSLSFLISYKLLPFNVYWISKISRKTHYFSFTYNIRTGELVFFDIKRINGGPGNDILDSYIYNTLYQLTTEKK